MLPPSNTVDREPGAPLSCQAPACQWKSTAVVVGLLVLSVLAFYCKLWWPGLLLIKRDATMTFLPIKQYMIERLAAGELPQWFPYDALGRPFIGVTVTGVFHPFTTLYFFLPAHDAYRASILISCLLAACGTFALSRTLQFSRSAAFLAGLTFACSGYVASMTENIQYLYPLGVLPLFLLSLEKILAGSPGWMVCAAVVWATVFLNGDVQTGYYFGFLALFWTAMRASPWQHHILLKLMVVTGMAVLIAGVQLGPSWAVFRESNRSVDSLFQENILTWSTHPLRLLTMVAWPNSEQSDPAEVGRVFFGGTARVPWAESLYVGIPVAWLAVMGACRRRDLRILTVLGLLATLLALGRYGGLYGAMAHAVPFWSAFRYPEKFMGFVSLSLAILAGAGFDAFRANPKHPAPWFVSALICFSIGGLLNTEAGQAVAAAIWQAPAELLRDVSETSARALFVSGAAACGVGAMTMLALKGWIRDTALTAGILAVIAVDLACANMRAYITGPTSITTFTPGMVRALRDLEGPPQLGRFRVATLHFGHQIRWSRRMEKLLGYYGAAAAHYRHALNGGMNAEFGIEGFRPTLPAYHPAFDAIKTSASKNELYARLNVSYFIDLGSRVDDQRLQDGLVYALPDFDVVLLHNPVPAKPRVYLSRSPEWITEKDSRGTLFSRHDFLHGEVDVIEAAEGTPRPRPAQHGTATIERYHPEEVQVRVDAPHEAVLILLDAYDQGWTARLETGEALPIMRANVLVRAVAIPAGDHLITFSYRTPLLKAGAIATLAGLLLSVGIAIAAPRLKRR
ncbi:MAG TPA: YfhO family protein [Nitrospiraceae bacterium]|nr:YfhO family protein [Nitrospiraceae bacterium]